MTINDKHIEVIVRQMLRRVRSKAWAPTGSSVRAEKRGRFFKVISRPGLHRHEALDSSPKQQSHGKTNIQENVIIR